MLLRASSQIDGTVTDVRAVRDDSVADRSNVAHAGLLLAWADATSKGSEADVAAARERLVQAAGPAAAVDTAAIMANFERMTRIADATGIPLDPPMNALSADIQETLGLRAFRSAASSRRAGSFAVVAARWLSPLLLRLMPRIAGRVRGRMQKAGTSDVPRVPG